MRAAPPVAPPIMGYSGANPVRALQGMQGGINRSGAVALPSLAQGIQQAGANRPRLDPVAGPPMQTALTGGGQNLVDAVRSPTASVPTFGTSLPTPTTMPSLPLAGASHTPGAAIGGVSASLANGGTLAGTTSPASSVAAVSHPALTSKPITSVSQSVQTAGANHQVGSTVGGVGSSLAGRSLASASSPAAAASNLTQAASAVGKPAGTPTFSTGTHTAPSGLFSAADPTRALKMMRGY
jgi:hypothetical protein